ncbi:MAG: 50S ribosomal protein L4 [Candidatus Pacebacteria bacterium]|nr:50S ribosomal protein L4 [Candidatus Paceibacterota bacterium]
MTKVKVYNIEGKESGEMDLPEEIFGLKVNDDLVHQAYVAHISNSRQVLADTKNRGEVRGGGKKPWKQKGTGRARHGSSRSPIWKGGGVTFGPTNDRNFSKKINKKMKTKALFMVLSSKLKDNELIVMDDVKLEKVSTKSMSSVIDKLSVKGKILFSFDKKDSNIFKSIKNIPNTAMIASNSLNIADLLKSKNLVINKKGIDEIKETYLSA